MYLHYMATAFLHEGNRVQALEWFDRLLNQPRKEREVHLALLKSLLVMGETERLSRSLREALAAFPEDIDLRLLEVMVHRDRRETDEALVRLRELDGRDDLSAGQCCSVKIYLAQLQAGRAGPDQVASLRAEVEDASVAKYREAGLWPPRDNLKDYLEVATNGAWAEAWRRRTGSVPAAFKTGQGAARAPIFLVGFPRSGTTLLERVLDAHPAITALPELPLLSRVVKEIGQRHRDYPACLPRLDDDFLGRLRRLYFDEARRLHPCPENQRLVDKQPLNFIEAPLIRVLFPEAPIVMLHRHPVDACISAFLQDFECSRAMSFFATLETTAARHAALMTLWRSYREELGLEAIEWRYEDLVKDPETQVRALMAALDVPFDPVQLRFHEGASNVLVKTPSRAQVREAIHTAGVGRWQSLVGELTAHRELLMPWMSRLGYAWPEAKQ